MPGRVFISHANEDKAAIARLRLIDHLHVAGFKTWLDRPEQIIPQPSAAALADCKGIGQGLDVDDDIAKGLEECDCVLVFATPTYLRKADPQAFDPLYDPIKSKKPNKLLRKELSVGFENQMLVWIRSDNATFDTNVKDSWLKLIQGGKQAMRVESENDLRRGSGNLMTRIKQVSDKRRADRSAPAVPCDDAHATLALALFNRDDIDLKVKRSFEEAPPRLKVATGSVGDGHDSLVDRLTAFILPMNMDQGAATLDDFVRDRLGASKSPKALTPSWTSARLRMPRGTGQSIFDDLCAGMANHMNWKLSTLEEKFAKSQEPVLFVVEADLARVSRKSVEDAIENLAEFWSKIKTGNAFMLVNVQGSPFSPLGPPSLRQFPGALALKLGPVEGPDVKIWLGLICKAWTIDLNTAQSAVTAKSLFGISSRARLSEIEKPLRLAVKETIWPLSPGSKGI